MTVVAFSDSHRRYDRVHELFEKTHRTADLYIFLGDGISDIEDMLYLYPEKKILAVAGNCDYGSMEKFVGVTEGDRGHRIFYSHGHIQRVKWSLDELHRAAKENCCDLALFGHTHIKHCEYRDGIYLVNPGSLGNPHDGGQPSYAVIQLLREGILVNHVEL